jgi:antitoxin (DNA-binding transcriptional repressor) of toxin-antitoxin stability system
VTITYHGEPVAELRPVEPAAGLEAHIERLAERGGVTARPDRRGALEPVARRPGALRRSSTRKRAVKGPLGMALLMFNLKINLTA